MAKEGSKGFYAGPDEHSYKSGYEIRSKNSPEFVMTPTKLPSERSFSEWAKHLKYIQEMRRQIIPLTDHIQVHYNHNLPVLIGIIGDHHIGSEADYGRMEDDVYAIRDTQGANAILMGDLVDGMFFSSGATQDKFMGLSEEVYMAQAMMNELKGKIIAAYGGDHDLDWAEQRSISLYHDFVERYGAHMMHGIGHIDVYMGNDGDDKPTHRMAGAHRHAGSSIYSRTAASQRLQRESAQSADIVFTGHTHQKGINEQAMPDSGGVRKLLFLTVGPYKQTDHWLRKQGYSTQKDDAIGGIGLILHPDGHKEAYWSIAEGATKLHNLSTI